MMSRPSLTEAKHRTYKTRDSWWTVFLVDPLAIRLLLLVSRWKFVTPNGLTVSAFVLGLMAAACFALGSGDRGLLVAGALLFHFSFVLDCMDGKLARLRATASVFGEWLDFILDRIRVLICAVALMGGAFAATGNRLYLYAGAGIVFLDMFRYLNGLQIQSLRTQMQRKIETPDVDELHREFTARFGFFEGLRAFLQRHRVRPHLFSGIEFQMGVFIIGPLTGLVLEATLTAAVLSLIFELAICYRFWLSAKDFTRATTGVTG
jgi:phosphatidylglycerophosphate synthase